MQTLVKWKVSLSNGKTLYENKGDFLYIERELSPWQRLLKYIEINKLSITSLSLYTDKGQTFNLPSSGKNPKFHIFTQLEKPISYKMFRVIGHDINSIKEDHFTIVEVQYKNFKLQLWVDNQHPENCWTLVI